MLVRCTNNHRRMIATLNILAEDTTNIDGEGMTGHQRTDLVLRKAEVSNPGHSRGKLASRWEGPYRVVRVIQDGTTP
ncbi:hypothetical protein B296_00029612 [Ensete ventricosum]|uniref:Uncharacterized protein n=1 Tax=Ensete ventricosum TaxID=4639 RepID=A0A426ZK22_ENSVE|nr:hypothetical protein B296_00029612 [Ensete ventricosum]